MPQSEIIFDKINKLINSQRLNESFLMLKKEMLNFPLLKDDLEKLKTQEVTYKYLLDYKAEGHLDPSASDMITQIKESLFRANDLLLRESLLKDSSDIYSSTRRTFAFRQPNLKLLLNEWNETFNSDSNDNSEKITQIISSFQSKTLNDIFNYVWTNSNWSKEELDLLSNTLESKDSPEYLKALLISAIILENLSYFDADSYEILLNIYESSENIQIKARAITGVVLIALIYPERIIGNLPLKSRFLLTSEENDFTKYINDIVFNIIRTYDTKRIDNKMRNEVIPGLMKINPELLEKMKNLSSDSEDFLSDANPQWEELIENSDLGEKIREINDMQLEGADVMVTAFSNLKSFPFFNIICNWFLPFTPGYYEFSSLKLDDELSVKNLTTVMCDSDLNSFLLSLSAMPEDKRSLMLSNMRNQMKEAYEAMESSIGDSYEQKISRNIKHTLQDLYRFFKFFKKKNDFKDPFKDPIEYNNIEPLLKLLGIKKENIFLIAEFYLKNKYYKEAAGFYEMLDRTNPGHFNIWEKIGYCYDRLHEYSRAVEWYKKADLVNPGNPWVEKKLALSLKNSGNIEDALIYYDKALEKEPENYHLLMSSGQCLLISNKFKEAINHFYHAEYLKPQNLDAQRAIAWTYLLSEDFENAIKQYEKILADNNADKSDYLNIAHCYLAKDNFKVALRLYKTYIEKSEKKEITSLVLAFRDDSDLLKKLGIKTSDLRLLIDKIRYDLIS